MTTNSSRREFLRRAGALSLAGTAAPWALNLAAMAEASAATASDYKALVCVFLYGGMDYANTLVPYDTASHARYLALRPSIAIPRADLAGTVLTPAQAPIDVREVVHQYALAPRLSALKPLFDGGKLGVMLNVGTLIEPTSKDAYGARPRTVMIPPRLFSHNDQQSTWQACAPEGAMSGWGGRMGDIFAAGNGNATFTCVNVSGNAIHLTGQTAVQYQVSPSGPAAVRGATYPLFGSGACRDALYSLITEARSNPLEATYNAITRRAIATNTLLANALPPASQFPNFPAGNPLAAQLQMVARMIPVSREQGVKRQVFFVSLGGFDHHSGLKLGLPGLHQKVGEAMAAFYNATVNMGVSEMVTSFTASDFGRTLTGNTDGSDHGWGGMHFMLGGAVNGGKYYGTAPVVDKDGPDDVGQGRLIPTTSVEQYAATMGKWLGIADSQLLALLPNLHNFYDTRDLGFMA